MYEILFMPYKASMWDSLESIYEAASRADDCHVTVMPVPYYHVNAERTELLTEYEGMQFPENVPITDYRQYSIPDMLPDVIFIHNPYDEKNRVTSLPERYFSSELVKYTNHLVYVPYKVCGKQVKDMYCVMPGVKNAWRVFVQSERVRETYIKYQPEEKIVVLGSPKIDKVLYNEAHKPKPPKEWENILAGRKVFLLNTHLSSILNDSMDMIRWMEELIAVFRECDNAAVIWRPHPLSMETATALKPEFLNEYKRMIADFRKLENGIYDETADVHTTMALADAYIGDGSSSLVIMFGVTGKPLYVRKAAAEEQMSVEDYVMMILKQRDNLEQLGEAKWAECVYDAKGKSGQLIWDYVKQELDCGR